MQLLQERIVALVVYIIQTSSLNGHLYALIDCRIKLYNVLHALITASHPLCPPPLQYAATMFSIAQVRDVNPSVRKICANHLRSIEKILHPQKEMLHFQAELHEVRDALKDLFKVNGKEDSVDDEQVSFLLLNLEKNSPIIKYFLIGNQYEYTKYRKP